MTSLSYYVPQHKKHMHIHTHARLIVKQITSPLHWKSKVNTRKIVETTINTNHFSETLSRRLIDRRKGSLE